MPSGKRSDRPSGRRSDCKQCESDRRILYKESAREYHRRYIVSEHGKKLRLERQRIWREENRDRERERQRIWREENKDRVREHSRRNFNRRRADKAGAPSHPYTREQVFSKKDNACYSCGRRIELSSFVADHVIPLRPREGHPRGCDCLANLMPQCHSCSSRKHNQHPSLDLFIKLWSRED